jgi:hypothetical protein
MPEQRKITAAIMKEWGPHKALRALGAPHHRGSVMHSRLCTQTISCISKTAIGQPGHSLLQDSMPDDEELDCVASKRKVLNWTSLGLNSLSHHTGFSTSVGFHQEKVMQDWCFGCLLQTQMEHSLECPRGLDSVELPTTGAAHPASENVQTSRMHLQTLCYRQIRGSSSLLHAARGRHNRSP